jgi:hypothetical protein
VSPPSGVTALDLRVIQDVTISADARGLFAAISSFPGGATLADLRACSRPDEQIRIVPLVMELLSAGVVVVEP